jgi:hypothetical protein
MDEKGTKTFAPRTGGIRLMRFVVVLALVALAFGTNAAAQQSGQGVPRSLTSEDLLGRLPAYSPATTASRVPSSTSSSSGLSPVGALYRDPSGAFSLNLPSGSWRLITKSQDKGKLSDLRVFRKLDAEGFAAATASIYMLSATAGLSVKRAAQDDAASQRALAEALVARFLSSSSEIVSATVERSGFQVVADQLVSRRAVVRASINAFEHGGRLYVIICRAPMETFDAQAREFSAITQSLAVSVARSS